MDRFMARLSVGYPDHDAQMALLKDRLSENPLDAVSQVLTREELLAMQAEARAVQASDALLHKAQRLLRHDVHIDQNIVQHRKIRRLAARHTGTVSTLAALQCVLVIFQHSCSFFSAAMRCSQLPQHPSLVYHEI